MSSTPPNLPPYPVSLRRNVTSKQAWTVRPNYSRPRPVSRPLPSQGAAPRLARRFDVEWLDGDEVLDFTRSATALPLFEQAFGAFAHGILIQTSSGLVAIEDLLPGTMIDCADGGVARVMWKGAITLVPGAPSMSDVPDRLYRVMADAFGPGRPMQDQTFGPHARRVDRDAKVRAALGTDRALLPLSAMADGASVVEVRPVSPTRVYHIACDRHATILAAGLEVETYHPGPEAPLSMSDEMMDQFMDFFPHLGSIADFGRLAAPRVSTDELASLA